MRVLVGCETSGQVRRAFAARGHEAWSCDLLPADDGHSMHMQCDVRVALRLLQWDMLIVHPDCTFLCSSGLHWNNKRPGRAQQTEDALEFVCEMLNADVPKIVLENSRGCIGTRIRPFDQSIQPYQFGHDASKTTDLWLKGVSPLVIDPALYVPPRLVCDHCRHVFKYGMHKCPACRSEKFKPRWANQTDSGQNKLGPSDDRWKERAATYAGIAEAFASNWGAA